MSELSDLMRQGLALAFLAAFACAGPAPAKPPVWTVHKDAATVVLFGSVHLLPPGVDWRPPALTRALAHADALWFELPIDANMGAEAGRLAEELGLLSPDDSLSAHLSPEDDARLKRITAALGLPLDRIERMRPWLAELSLSVTQYAAEGARASAGVEMQIQNEAPPTAVRRAFETAEFQVRLLADAPMADQVASLSETLKEMDERPDLFRDEVKEWLAGDLAGLERDALAPLAAASPADYARLITARNERWEQQVEGMLRTPGTSVVVVGEGHLVGPQGLPALLRARGFAVDGP